MICFYCEKIIPLKEVCAFNIVSNDIIVKKICICQECSKELIMALIKAYNKQEELK